MDDQFAADPPEWEPGQIVEWRALEGTGRIVHVPEDQNILMVEVLEQTDDGWEETGHTLTAGYSDVIHKNNDPQMGRDQSRYSDTVKLHNTTEDDFDGAFGVNIEFSQLPESAISDGFNRHGVRENDDGSIDVRFNVMEPGVRKGVEITPEFLRSVASYDYGTLPLQLDHSDSQRANVGYIEPSNIKFAGDGTLRAQAHIPDTGSDIRDDVIADFTHEPPQITDISIGFDPRSLEVEKPAKRDGTPKFVDGRIREFSLTPFPAGYDNGGLTPEFSSAVEDLQFTEESDDAESQLLSRPHNVIRK